MKLLVAIANFGQNHTEYCHRLISEYRKSGSATDIVILSDVEKDYGPDVQVIVGLPSRNPWSLPFGHRKLFCERRNEYDAYIYSEDDILITKTNIDSFLEVTATLPEGRIAGFTRYEKTSSGTRYLNDIHGSHHWDPQSVEVYKNETFAYLTNEHSACSIMTRDQLRRAIESNGFLVAPHCGNYDLLCTAANDIYTQCGFKKLLCISRFEDFLVHHLPDNYARNEGRYQIFAVTSDEAQLEIDEMIRSRRDGNQLRRLPISAEVRWEFLRKRYYEKPDDQVLNLVPAECQRILSIGTAMGSTERALHDRGKTVWAVPLNDLMSVPLRKAGIRVTAPIVEESARELSGLTFDLILVSNVLEYYRKPGSLLAIYRRVLERDGKAVIAVANHAYVGFGIRRLLRRSNVFPRRDLTSFEDDGLHYVTLKRAREWTREAGMSVVGLVPVYGETLGKLPAWMLRPFAARLAKSFLLLAKPRDGRSRDDPTAVRIFGSSEDGIRMAPDPSRPPR